MTPSDKTFPGLSRRTALLGGLAAIGAVAVGCSSTGGISTTHPVTPDFTGVENGLAGRLGVYALDTGSGATVAHRSDERFLMCSTVKTFIVASILHLWREQPGLLGREIFYTKSDILESSPETSKHVTDGRSVKQLCEAAIRYSDNTAANLLLQQIGGPKAVEKFLRGLGDSVSNVNRMELTLNIPDGDKDTSTPHQMVTDLQSILLGSGLDASSQNILSGWMKTSVTGDQSIRAGVPLGWTVGDKTGSGYRGETNDTAIIWPPNHAPLVIAVFANPNDPKSTKGKAAIAEVTKMTIKAFGL